MCFRIASGRVFGIRASLWVDFKHRSKNRMLATVPRRAETRYPMRPTYGAEVPQHWGERR